MMSHVITSSYNHFIIMRMHRWPYGPCLVATKRLYMSACPSVRRSVSHLNKAHTANDASSRWWNDCMMMWLYEIRLVYLLYNFLLKKIEGGILDNSHVITSSYNHFIMRTHHWPYGPCSDFKTCAIGFGVKNRFQNMSNFFNLDYFEKIKIVIIIDNYENFDFFKII